MGKKFHGGKRSGENLRRVSPGAGSLLKSTQKSAPYKAPTHSGKKELKKPRRNKKSNENTQKNEPFKPNRKGKPTKASKKMSMTNNGGKSVGQIATLHTHSTASNISLLPNGKTLAEEQQASLRKHRRLLRQNSYLVVQPARRHRLEEIGETLALHADLRRQHVISHGDHQRDELEAILRHGDRQVRPSICAKHVPRDSDHVRLYELDASSDYLFSIELCGEYVDDFDDVDQFHFAT